MMVRMLPALAVLLATSCASTAVPAPNRGPAILVDCVSAEKIASRADETMRTAMAARDPTALSSAFAGPALRALLDQLDWFRERGMSLEERNPRRALVAWDGARDEVVIQVEAQDRLVSADQPDPPWSNALHQRWMRIGLIDGEWRVVGEKELTPDQWRSPLTGCVPWLDGRL